MAMQSARLLGRRLRHRSPIISPHCFSALSGCPVPPASPRPRRPWSAAPRAGGASRCCASSEKLPMTRKMRCSARRWSTWRRDGLASGWRRPSAGLRVITPRASGSPPPRPRLVGAGTQQWPAERSAGSSIDAIVPSCVLPSEAAGATYTARGRANDRPPAQFWGRRGGPGLLRSSLDLGVRAACRAASRPHPNVGLGLLSSSGVILCAGRAWPPRGWTWTRS